MSLAEGRYRWRHDQVLKCLAGSIDKETREKAISDCNEPSVIHFVKEGSVVKSKARPHKIRGLLRQSSDWQLMVDLGKQLKFPADLL